MLPLASAFIAELSELGVQSIAEAIHPAAGKVVGFFKGVWKRYRGKQKKQDERAEVERIARMTAAEVVAAVRPELVRAFPDNPKLRQEAELYFAQMPGAVTRSLRRKDDPSGKSVPDDFDLDAPEKLAVLYPATAPQFRPGDDLSRRAGKWRLIDPVGSGGFGEVWKARNLLTRQFGAVKFCTDPAARLDLIRHELTQALRLNDDDNGWPAGVVPVLDYDLDGEHPWILFEFLDGGTLEDVMHELAGVPVPQRVPRSVALLVELTAAVVPLHSLKKTPLVHRDLKPANVLLDSAGRLRITDLGLGGSAIETERSLESQGGYHRVTGRLPTQLQGSYSLHYASKQQRAGLPTTTQDDVFSLGVIAYQMLTGKLDIGPGTDADDELRELGVPDELVKVVKACASDEPKRRPANAMALGERLAACLQPEGLSPPAQASGLGNGVVETPSLKGSFKGDGATPSGSTSLVADSPGRSPGLKETALRAEDKPPANPVRVIPLAATYFVALNGVQAGPFDVPTIGAKVTTGEVSASTLVWQPGLANWVALETLPELRSLLDPSTLVRKAGDRHEITLPDGVPMAFAWCPPGKFLMGSPPSEEDREDDEQQHEVTLTKGFYMGVHQVTQAQYQAVMGTNPSHFKGDTLPVEKVSWKDAVKFCGAVKQKTGAEVRLPTEAEWEYAARGGSMTAYPGGDTEADLAAVGWYHENSGSKTHPVGQKKANVWNLHDMHGNVWEWCSDWYDEEFYAKPEATKPDPDCKDSIQTDRILRGGSWYFDPGDCRAANRGHNAPAYRYDYVGFRVCAVLD